jgi:hypothetical protein
LLVGHTHEDIDAIFALIWKKLFPKCIYDPYEFRDLILDALRKKGDVYVKDIFAVPGGSAVCIFNFFYKLSNCGNDYRLQKVSQQAHGLKLFEDVQEGVDITSSDL